MHPAEDVYPVVPNEALTKVVLTFVNDADQSDVQTSYWKQLNPLISPTVVGTIQLKPNSTYTGSIQLFNVNTDVTGEIRDEENYHHFFYQPLPINNISNVVIPGAAITSDFPLELNIAITDTDANTPPLPVGLKMKATTGSNSNGSIRVVLRHQPEGKDGSFAPGNSDFDSDPFNFPVVITP